MEDEEPRSDDLERDVTRAARAQEAELDELERRSNEVRRDTDEARSDWERKRADPRVPGAQPREEPENTEPADTLPNWPEAGEDDKPKVGEPAPEDDPRKD